MEQRLSIATLGVTLAHPVDALSRSTLEKFAKAKLGKLLQEN